ncbi:SMI1/KNR4 family protein [Paenibacillus alvei]|uniref:SMI1/KNR4 family protein n=1 Tax=Paenibacillus alvei TaxID=44250 RepID=UPI0018CF6292|nr:SMI1/KNR4 family protein [Paenibacillus alvei]MBG9732985.1 hypothetical protein [Paenibacillus alvei]MBG9745007.1 hypothetical protein [Paenibacillus alvei]MCY9581889.1 SMI1/KNR4 family protein [Paenibacillus alvei]MCY9586777.1 SMI1/KNR4 family protein [Paenibacillus alvei]
MKTIKTLLQSFEGYTKAYPNQEIVAFTCNGDVSKYVVEWKPPVSKNALEHFFEKNHWYIPSDLKEFYLLHNGGVLFKHPHYGGGISILTMNAMQSISDENENIPKHWYPIAWTDHTIGSICIDSERCRLKQYPYIFFLDAMKCSNEAIAIHTDFSTWLTRLLVCQGEEYWMWDYYDKLTFQTQPRK